jgi:hypothetical protein
MRHRPGPWCFSNVAQEPAMKITVKTPKPRNPLARAARMRHAGSHRASGGSQRHQGLRALRRELTEMKHSP